MFETRFFTERKFSLYFDEIYLVYLLLDAIIYFLVALSLNKNSFYIFKWNYFFAFLVKFSTSSLTAFTTSSAFLLASFLVATVLFFIVVFMSLTSFFISDEAFSTDLATFALCL
jgi:hypothetical protein